MILEWLETLATPCAPALRDLRYRTELIAIGARYRRCRRSWADHLARSRRAIEAAIARAPRRRTAVILGSGRLLDVPLAALAAGFERVVLVDMLHPVWARLRSGTYANVECLAADITGVVEPLHRWTAEARLVVPRSFALLDREDVDLVVSLNVLSQLAVLPVEWLEPRIGADAAAAFGAALTRKHLDDLARCCASVCLIADVEWRNVRPDGSVVEAGSSIYDLPVPAAVEEWVWPIAPAPEADPVISEHRRVIVAIDPGKDGD